MLRDKLHRFSGQIVRARETMPHLSEKNRYGKAAKCLGGEVISHSNGTYLKISFDFTETYSYGKSALADLMPLTRLRKRHFLAAETDALIDLRRLLFFDMETTGLSGGAGTVAFLIGFGSIVGEVFQVRQYFLPDYSDEEAMLEAVRSEIKEDSILVSYNGKAFDLPILLDRLILHRIERRLEFDDHIDLLHTARRLYRRRLKDCSLTNIERCVLEHFRFDDIPGYLVPSVYFNWLATEETTDLNRVVKHNADDIVALFFIMHHIADVLENPSAKIVEPDDILSLAHILLRHGSDTPLHELLESFEQVFWRDDRHDILFLHSLSYKRAAILPKAVAIWEKMSCSSTPEAFFARIELAKYYEHRARDARAALEQAEEARKICPARQNLTFELEKRINRLIRKLSA